MDTTEKVTTVHGFVRNETGPVNGTLILLSLSSLSSRLPLYNASTDVSRGGEYHLKNVQPGSYRVMIVVSTGFLFLEENKEVHEGENVWNWTLTARYALQGVVRSGQNPMPDVTVTLISERGGDKHTVTTSGDGGYEFNDLLAGNYTVTFSKSGYRTMEKAISLPDDSTLDIEMERMGLPARDGFLAGYDLGHSLMVVALGLAVATLIVALFARYQVRKKPELLSRDDSEA